MKTISTWVSWCFLGIYMIDVCSAAVSTSGTQELDEFAAQGQQTIASSAGRFSPLSANRVSNRAIRGPQPNVPATRASLQQKSASTSKLASTSSRPEEQNNENDENVAEQQAEGDESSADQEEEQPSATSSTTEAPRKKAGFSVRPFRSQQDLIESLKRRRLMVQQHGYTISTSIPTSTTERIQSKSTLSTRKNGNSLNKNSAQPGELNGFQKKSTTASGRRHYVKPTLSTTTTAVSSNNDAITEESNVVPQPARSSRTYPKTRRTNT